MKARHKCHYILILVMDEISYKEIGCIEQITLKNYSFLIHARNGNQYEKWKPPLTLFHTKKLANDI